ncbi:DNA gyrase inhibitor YacG [Fulvimarina sp. 2208YS6-2-32]|uniref:DNA gyrase inhibitor YacG n=1 Tax=Fulvimarina uroteuthidis TaxID=3098149 RepID=A0ABU5I255_9HYPH|nr:DNA gyrase inhibitor YacG [Fulvimarina sp. 2208YS6-2-32]MDY8109444.1 DNA gyrase inhibitor YacG [Fulvimarina sp. 2208YS6-2-32]
MSSTVTPLRPKRKCPECRRDSTREHFPFCSERCKAVDLNRWLGGHYVIPGPSLSSDDEDSDR